MILLFSRILDGKMLILDLSACNRQSLVASISDLFIVVVLNRPPQIGVPL